MGSCEMPVKYLIFVSCAVSRESMNYFMISISGAKYKTTVFFLM